MPETRESHGNWPKTHLEANSWAVPPDLLPAKLPTGPGDGLARRGTLWADLTMPIRRQIVKCGAASSGAAREPCPP